jgi:predicted amidophosphoribosyltransferase
VRQRLGACGACWAALAVIAPESCSGCGLPRPLETDLFGPAGGRCARCAVQPLAVDGVRAAVVYDAIARAFLLRAKLGRRPELLEAFGRQLGRVLELDGLAADCTAVVPVPSHPWARLRRGFNPALELARPIARDLGLPLHRAALRRRLGAQHAFKRQAAARRRILATAAFGLSGDVRGARVLLVDDVMTTGSTVEACARLLRAGGAATVHAAVWARTLPRDPG